ncbi:MAG TPA: DUF3078 domain-containing protein [Flavitalea sp.]|nr:DUF3078 domain-containing protein [Flavitalea sp.]
MRNVAIVAVLFFSSLSATAQDNIVKGLQADADKKFEKDTVHKSGWKQGGLFTLNVAQGSLSNWQGGGDKNSFSAVGFLNLFEVLREGKNLWNNSLDLGYGYINTTSLGSRKSDDRIDLVSKYGYQIGSKWYAGALFNFRSQFAEGFVYEKDVNGAEIKTLTSKFMAPAYILLSPGFDFKPTSSFSLFLSPVTERWIIVNDDLLSALGAYGVKPGSKSRNELGAFVSATFNKNVMENVTFKSRFDGFSNYKSKPGNVDIFWTNVLAMKVNKYLSANVAIDLLYDDDAISRLQLRQLLGIGLSAKF